MQTVIIGFVFPTVYLLKFASFKKAATESDLRKHINGFNSVKFINFGLKFCASVAERTTPNPTCSLNNNCPRSLFKIYSVC